MPTPAALLLALTALAPPAAQAGASLACEELAGRFRAALEAFRGGDEALTDELGALSADLCAACARCDARDVAAYYMGLTPAERRTGLEEERRFARLYQDVLDAGSAGLAGEAWARERERLLGELRMLAARVRAAPDFVPAARAQSFAARLVVEALEGDPTLDPLQQEALAEAARRDAVEALALLERAGLRTPQLEPRWLVARLDLAGRRFASARAGFEEVLELARVTANDDFTEHALRGLARLARAAGDARGEDRLLVELASFRDPRASWPLARDWAGRLLSEDHAEEALEFLERCAPAEGAHRLDTLEWDLSMGAALARLGELSEARVHLERAAAEFPSEAAVLGLAQLALEEGRGFEARVLLDDPARLAGFSERGRAEAWRILGEERLEADDAEGAVAALERARELAERWRSRLAPRLAEEGESALGPAGVESVFGEWAGLHALALQADALRRAGRPVEALQRIAQDHSRSLREARAGAASLRALVAGEDPTRVTPEDLARWVGRAELGLVAWVVGSDFSVVVHAWLEDGELRARAARLARGRAAVADAARRLREAAISGDPVRLQREAEAARAAVLPAELCAGLRARAEVLGADARLILLVHGPLERLPFELLPLAPGDVPLDQRLTVLALPGLADATPPRPLDPSALETWTLLGAPPAAPGFPHLPGAARELEEIAALRPGARRAAGADFTREALERALRSGRALHVATHLAAGAKGDGGPALVVAGGERLDADQVRALAAPLPIVVLPACETGGGAFVDAQGLHGLARAFLETGTRDLLVTLWPVQDESARAFSVAFHRALTDGATPARAARAGRAAVRDAGFGPAEWAAFRLLGAD